MVCNYPLSALERLPEATGPPSGPFLAGEVARWKRADLIGKAELMANRPWLALVGVFIG